MICLDLFLSFIKIGLLSFGGGYAAMPLIQHELVEMRHWLDMSEFSDIITISQMTPGPIAVNAATFSGMKLAGTAGAISATLGCILPSAAVVLILAKLYYKYRRLSLLQGMMNGLRPAVVALIASSGISLLMTALWNGTAADLKNTDVVSALIFALSLAALRFIRPNQIWVMAAAGFAGGVIYSLIL